MVNVMNSIECSVVVVGGGSGGIGAALAASRLGADTVLIEKENIRHTSKQCIHQMISSQKRARVHDESLAAKYMSTMKLASPRDFLQLQTYTHYPIPRSLNILLWRRERQCAHKEQSLS